MHTQVRDEIEIIWCDTIEDLLRNALVGMPTVAPTLEAHARAPSLPAEQAPEVSPESSRSPQHPPSPPPLLARSQHSKL